VPDADAYEMFAARVGERFRVRAGRDVEATLRAVEASPQRDGYTGGFSLYFTASGELLAQGTYRFEHDDLEPIDIFIVPIGRRDDQVEYEAVFT
jgi:hypothetical protein